MLANYDGLQKGGVAQTSAAKALKGKTLFYNREQIDTTARKSSLKEKGVIDGATLELKGYTALSRLNHVYSLSVYDPYHIKVTVDVYKCHDGWDSQAQAAECYRHSHL